MIPFIVYKHRKICIAWLNCRAGFATAQISSPFDHMTVEKTLMQTFASQLSLLTLINSRPRLTRARSWENSHAKSCSSTVINFLQYPRLIKTWQLLMKTLMQTLSLLINFHFSSILMQNNLERHSNFIRKFYWPTAVQIQTDHKLLAQTYNI